MSYRKIANEFDLNTTWYVLSVTMKEINSNLPNEILKSVRDIEIEKFIEEEEMLYDLNCVSGI